MPSVPETHPATMTIDKGPPQQNAPTGTTNTDHEAALLDQIWAQVPHTAPQTLKDGALVIIRQLKAEHEAEVKRIEAAHEQQTKLNRIDHLELVVSLKEEIHEKDVAISKAQLEKESAVTLRDYEIQSLKKDYQEAIQGYVRRERELEAGKAAALQGKQTALNLQRNSSAEAKSIRNDINELQSKCRSLQQDLRCVTQMEVRKSTQLFNIEKKRSEEKKQVQRAERRLADMEPMDEFLEERSFVPKADKHLHRPLSWLEMERAIRVAAYGVLNLTDINPAEADDLITSSRRLAGLGKKDRRTRYWRDADFFVCVYDLIAEIMETVQTNDHVRKTIAKDARSIDQTLSQD